MLDKIESKQSAKSTDVIDRGKGKRSKILSKVKLVENISKNLQSFLEITPALLCRAKRSPSST